MRSRARRSAPPCGRCLRGRRASRIPIHVDGEEGPERRLNASRSCDTPTDDVRVRSGITYLVMSLWPSMTCLAVNLLRALPHRSARGSGEGAGAGALCARRRAPTRATEREGGGEPRRWRERPAGARVGRWFCSWRNRWSPLGNSMRRLYRRAVGRSSRPCGDERHGLASAGGARRAELLRGRARARGARRVRLTLEASQCSAIAGCRRQQRGAWPRPCRISVVRTLGREAAVRARVLNQVLRRAVIVSRCARRSAWAESNLRAGVGSTPGTSRFSSMRKPRLPASAAGVSPMMPRT